MIVQSQLVLEGSGVHKGGGGGGPRAPGPAPAPLRSDAKVPLRCGTVCVILTILICRV